MSDAKGMLARAQSGFLGSLRDALAAAGRDDSASADVSRAMPDLDRADPVPELLPPAASVAQAPTAAEAARAARGGAPNVPPLSRAEVPVDLDDEVATRRVPHVPTSAPAASADRTRVLRGKPKVDRGGFEQDPVVGWLVVVGGPGMGACRPIFEGNNTIGRSSSQRIPIDFGDDAISSDEQAYIRYDSAERSFLFVPNLAKTNIVSLNGKRPTAAVALGTMDVIQMGRTQLVFVPFCGPDFDWSEIGDKPL